MNGKCSTIPTLIVPNSVQLKIWRAVIPQSERIIKLNQIAIQQMRVLERNNNRNLFNVSSTKYTLTQIGSLENDKKLFLMTDLGSWLLAIGCRFLVRFALLIEKSSIRKGNLTKNQ